MRHLTVSIGALCLSLPAITQAAVLGAMTPAQPLSETRIAALPAAERAQWTGYLTRSRALMEADKAALAAERADPAAAAGRMRLGMAGCRCENPPPGTGRPRRCGWPTPFSASRHRPAAGARMPTAAARRAARASPGRRRKARSARIPGAMSAPSTTAPPPPRCASWRWSRRSWATGATSTARPSSRACATS
ncbi:exported hypothetical protein [Massilia sp. 9I]|nr:exported hypothetical protein [Massilia sp. 9I]